MPLWRCFRIHAGGTTSPRALPRSRTCTTPTGPQERSNRCTNKYEVEIRESVMCGPDAFFTNRRRSYAPDETRVRHLFPAVDAEWPGPHAARSEYGGKRRVANERAAGYDDQRNITT